MDSSLRRRNLTLYTLSILQISLYISLIYPLALMEASTITVLLIIHCAFGAMILQFCLVFFEPMQNVCQIQANTSIGSSLIPKKLNGPSGAKCIQGSKESDSSLLKSNQSTKSSNDLEHVKGNQIAKANSEASITIRRIKDLKDGLDIVEDKKSSPILWNRLLQTMENLSKAIRDQLIQSIRNIRQKCDGYIHFLDKLNDSDLKKQSPIPKESALPEHERYEKFNELKLSEVIKHLPIQEESTVPEHEKHLPIQEKSIVPEHEKHLPIQEESIVPEHEKHLPNQEESIVPEHEKNLPNQESAAIEIEVPSPSCEEPTLREPENSSNQKASTEREKDSPNLEVSKDLES